MAQPATDDSEAHTAKNRPCCMLMTVVEDAMVLDFGIGQSRLPEFLEAD